MHEEKLHFLVSFSLETQFEVRQNDPEQVFEGNIFAQIAAILQWHALDQTVTLGLVIIIAYGSAHV